MYISNYEGFEGDGSPLTKFGVRIADETALSYIEKMGRLDFIFK